MKKENEDKVRLNLVTQFIKKAEFTAIKPSYELAKDKNINPQVNFQILPKQKFLGDGLYEISLEAKIKPIITTTNEEIFNLEIEYCCICEIKEALDAEKIEKILLVDVVTLLFPFLRREVANLIVSGGYSPVMLDPMDFGALYSEYKTKAKIDNKGE